MLSHSNGIKIYKAYMRLLKSPTTQDPEQKMDVCVAAKMKTVWTEREGGGQRQAESLFTGLQITREDHQDTVSPLKH